MRRIALVFVSLLLIACKPPTFEEGWGNVLAKNDAKAIEIWIPLAENGDVRAQVELGILYQNGSIKDPAKSFKYFKMAADQGQMYGNFAVGHAYRNGLGVEKNNGYAESRYLKAANNGFVLPMMALVSLYDEGRTVSGSQRINLIRRWAVAAFERGEKVAAFSIAHTYRIDEAEKTAWYNAAREISIKEGKPSSLDDYISKANPDQQLKVMLLEQEISRLYNHIEPANPLPWRNIK